MKLLKAYKYKLLPTQEQKEFLNTCMSANRFMWNAMLNTYNEHWDYQVNKYGYIKDDKGRYIAKALEQKYMSRQLTELKNCVDFPFLKVIPSRCGDLLIKVFYTAWGNYFRRLKNGEIAKEKAKYLDHCKTTGRRISFNRLRNWGKPKYKSYLDKQSFQTDRTYKIDFESKKLSIKKHNINIRISDKDKVYEFANDAKTKTITVERSKTGLYYISILFEMEVDEFKKPMRNKSLGIDLGTKHLAITSEGAKYENPKNHRKYQNQLRKLQQKASRQWRQNKCKTKNWEKTQQKIKKLQAKIANCRKYSLHQLTHSLTSTKHDTLVIEDLNAKGMMATTRPKQNEEGYGFAHTGKKRKKGLNKDLADASFGEIRRQLEYKTEWRGKNLVVANRFFASSQTCSNCGYKDKEVKEKNLRTWTCSQCGTNHDRDINAAKNLAKFDDKIGAFDSEPSGMPMEVRNASLK